MIKKTIKKGGDVFTQRLWKESWTYIQTVVDTTCEPFLILDKELRVLVANESFYKTFHAEQIDTEKKLVYELGNGQWNIPALRRLLEDILLHNTFFKGFEVKHNFPVIGNKVMILNAREIHCEHKDSEHFQPIILLAMEDITEIIMVAEKFVLHASEFEATITEKTNLLESMIKKLETEIIRISDVKKVEL